MRKLRKPLLKLQAAKSRHFHVKKDAAGSRIFKGTQEAGGGFIVRDFIAGNFQ